MDNESDNEFYHSINHAERSLKKMEDYYHHGELCDVILIIGAQRIHAHRIVLSAASDYFAAMFTSDVREAQQEEVPLKDVDSDSVLALVEYCYTGQIDLREDNVENLLSTASILQLLEVVEACCGFLMKQLHPSNCIGIRSFADVQGCCDLLKVAHNYAMDHFMEIMRNQEYLILPVEEVIRLLSNDDINVPNEETIYQAMMLWVKHDLPNRRQYLAKLMSHIKLPLLSPEFIADRVESNLLFKDDRECQDLIMEAMKYHLLPERRSTLQSPRTRPRKSTVGFIYAVGGVESNKGPNSCSIEKYDPRTNSWTQVDSISGHRLQFGVAVVEDKLFVVGGRDGLKTLNTVEAYSLKEKKWTTMPTMSTHRHGLGVGVLEGPLYACGGHDGWSYLSTVERWDAHAKQWSYVAPMHSPRSTLGVAVLNGRLYAIGGRDGKAFLRSVECYDPHTNRWTLCTSMSKRRGGVGVAVSSGFLYAVGGYDTPTSNATSNRFDSVERYDPKTDVWTTVARISPPRDSIGVCLMGEKLFAVGGYDGQAFLNTVECYDPQNNEWVQVAPLCMARAGACIVHVLKI
ncbi:PREDICTED: kelch-like protein 5 [Priapulus caudatus]|uniref:Kelch-like protein 5 n=1 Tax=Priapulus caudatus TaxID=37621 RepID=A0ABM1DTH0_PRICU|nr:PREDICTED: kelch-like protein 5 [Priapulus caudatus]XP_014663238.1 PREDICTED: kelch-like protein 5 [Priapulus caudatus]XP_014663239.1 PREDICTED: kelch-like protein 5 [Priapulus caudatus]XP_014663240.1 PREDICTED: kelch-like protein 5 [Priapulus caudatus]XP_014663241.1 PREDICTED: kelch-like protein 5 [Priapulus caudatus]